MKELMRLLAKGGEGGAALKSKLMALIAQHPEAAAAIGGGAAGIGAAGIGAGALGAHLMGGHGEEESESPEEAQMEMEHMKKGKKHPYLG